jgi:hypothetical protein
MNRFESLRADHMRRQRLWAAPPVIEKEIRDLRKQQANEQAIGIRLESEIAEKVHEIGKSRAMANTGARGFAAMLKARAEELKTEFSKLHDEINGELDAQKNLLQDGKAVHAEMKKDTADLREAFGLGNNPPA